MPESPREGLEFQRPQGWRFAFEGVNLRDVPDALPPTKFASAKNIRATATQSVQTRPGYTLEFATGGNPVTDLRAYATLETDDKPRYLARDSVNAIYLDTGALVTTLAGAPGSGVAMVPFRPSESPQAWMYVAGLGDYQKISAPDNTNTVVAQKVGIAEPLDQCEPGPRAPGFAPFDNAFGISGFTATGTAGAPSSGTRSTDTAGKVISENIICSMQVGSAVGYGIGELVQIGADFHVIQDVLPPVSLGTISAIRYNGGTSGDCTIVPTQAAIGPPTVASPQFLAGLRRGSMVQVGSEIVMVLGVATGPDGSICFDTSTVNTHAAGETLTGLPAIRTTGNTSNQGQNILASMVTSAVTTGIGYLGRPLFPGNFTSIPNVGLNLDDQYVHISCLVDNIANLNEIRILFNVDSEASPTFAKNYYYYSIQPSLFAQAIANQQTQTQALLNTLVQSTTDIPLPDQSIDGSSQWTELYIQLSSFTRVGGDETRTLANCNGVQILIDASANLNFSMSSLYVMGRAQPDVGDDGAPYRYRAVPRSSLTGVKGNPTPVTRYGVTPRLQPVAVSLPDITADTQIDIWDIYRYGGTVTSYRYIGSVVPSNGAFFEDIYSDEAALGGQELETDNYEPWPSVDVPFKVNVGGGVTVDTFGTWIVVTGAAAWPSTILRWLPGTLVQIGAQSAYTLRSRPQQLSSSSYLFETEECIGPQVTPTYFWVLEPQVARQFVPYVFGPDVEGTFFSVGDPLRPGMVPFTKQNSPDSAPAKYTLELCPPSEPLLGGIIKGGVSLVASTKRWWALYPAFQTTQRYSPIEQSVGRGLISPYGHITDGNLVYFWTRDGIAITDGGPYKSLTDADLYNLFPHEGVAGVNVTRNGVTYYAPDYSQAAKFRLGKINQYLFADYPDTDGVPRTLVCDLRTGGWVTDIYADLIDIHYGAEQQTGSLTSAPATYAKGLLADARGNVWLQVDCAGDNSNKIPCLVAPFEWDGGDLRSQPLFGDAYLDCVPQSVVTVTPVSQGSNIGTSTVILATGSRTFSPISIQGGELQKFCGLVITWSD
jgi:hypothetical protein